VLTVTVEGHDNVRAFLQGEADAGLERRALTPVNDMPQDERPGLFCAPICGVRRAIIHHNDVSGSRQQRFHHTADRPFLVISGDDDE
jgi:hypothetical protein